MGLESELEPESEEENKGKLDRISNYTNAISLEELTEISAGLIGGAMGATISYNIAGAFATASDFPNNVDICTTTGILTYGTIKGYKVFSRLIKNVKSKIKRNIARTKILREMSQNSEFLERQGIKKGRF